MVTVPWLSIIWENVRLTTPHHIDTVTDHAAVPAALPSRMSPTLYAELQRIAQAVFAGEGAGHTLSRTAVMHEAWLRLAERTLPSEPDFLRLAARVIRNVLVDHARARDAAKRGGAVPNLSLDETLHHFSAVCATGLYPSATPTEVGALVARELDLEAIERALVTLEVQSARQAQIVEMKFFADMSHEAIASSLGVSVSTVKREWTVARLFLLRELAAERATRSAPECSP